MSQWGFYVGKRQDPYSEQSPVLSVLADRHITSPFFEACRRTVAPCLLLTCGLAVLRTVYLV